MLGGVGADIAYGDAQLAGTFYCALYPLMLNGRKA